ncbi:MAG: ATP-binding protein [Candidatus Hydrogenedentales bacterium]
MIPRHLANTLIRAAKQYPIVTVTGPRQSGKTTLARAAFNKHEYVSLENPDERTFAAEDPRGFLARFRGPVIFDEAQRVPSLFSYLQEVVDNEDRAGRFVLTGSQNFLLLNAINQSLAGRTSVLHLLPLTYGEVIGRKPLSADAIGRDARKSTEIHVDPFQVMHRGFYPRIHDKKLDAQDWLRNYTQTYLERDVREIVNVGDIEAFGRFLRLCAGRCGQLLNVSGLGADCGISSVTARRWLSILETSFIVFLLRPHHRNFSKRLVKSPKLYFFDTGLLCYLLRIRSPEDLRTHAQRGSVFESFVISETAKHRYNRGVEPYLYFWRDSTGNEVDLILDWKDRLLPVEIKSGETVADDFFKGLEYWCGLEKEQSGQPALVYGGDVSYKRHGMNVYSWRDWV